MSLQKRLRLYGKTASKIQIAKEVSNLLLGNSRLKKEPKNISEIASTLGFKERRSVYNYLEIGVTEGFVKRDSNGQYEKPEKSNLAQFKEFSKNHPILQDALVSSWYLKLTTRKQGKGIVSAKNWLNMIERICNTCKCKPEELIDSTESAERFKAVYIEAYKNGTDWQKVKVSRGGIETLDYRASYAIASFGAPYGISWPRGTSDMSRKIVGHAQYADIRFTNEEFEKANKFIIEKWGLDSDPFRWFWMGIETCSRYKALQGMKLDFEIHLSKDKKNFSGNKDQVFPEKETLLMKVYEAKTKEINKGIWKKYIKRKDTIESLKLLKARGGTRIFESKLAYQKFESWIQDCMRDIFKHLGKEGIFLERPTHVLRHLGAHYGLAKGNYTNHVLIAKIGGWHTIDEMIRSYGELPPEKVLEELDKYD